LSSSPLSREQALAESEEAGAAVPAPAVQLTGGGDVLHVDARSEFQRIAFATQDQQILSRFFGVGLLFEAPGRGRSDRQAGDIEAGTQAS